MSRLTLYVVVYERIDGIVSVEDSGLCLSTAAARAKECAASLLSESVWSEAEQATMTATSASCANRRRTDDSGRCGEA